MSDLTFRAFPISTFWPVTVVSGAVVVLGTRPVVVGSIAKGDFDEWNSALLVLDDKTENNALIDHLEII